MMISPSQTSLRFLRKKLGVLTSESCRIARGHRNPVALASPVLGLFLLSLVCGGSRLASNESNPCLANPQIDLVFMVDRSGSMGERGVTYNIQIEGILESLRDPCVIPRDGSVAITVFTFAEEPAFPVLPFTIVSSATVADAARTTIGALRCPAFDPCPISGARPATNYAPAINLAMTLKHRPQARRVLLISSDGDPTDLDSAETAAANARKAGASELDVILVGLDPNAPRDPATGKNEYQANKEKVDRLVFPEPGDTLPGATLVVPAAGPCNMGTARSTMGDDCSQTQITLFARTHVRGILRSHILDLKVTSLDDPDPNTQATGLSLRQAIERANANVGRTSITFDRSLKDKTIRLNSELPPIRAPGVRIDGCATDGCEGSDCLPSITIDGNSKFDDGISIQSTGVVVRGLKIVGFKKAGVRVTGLNPSDNVGCNRIEGNTFQDNAKGVVVVDPPRSPGDTGVHNERNTILSNDIFGSSVPIDLGDNGRTPNGAGGADNGPNRLINFPEIEVTGDPTNATVSGELCKGACPQELIGARVEIFSVTTFAEKPSTAPEGSDRRMINGVHFLNFGTVDANGSFRVTNIEASPTCGYAATVTDTLGNTSEMGFPCRGFGKARIRGEQEVLFPLATAGQTPEVVTLTIENPGCGDLSLLSASARRIDAIVKLAGSDDTRFSIKGLGARPDGQMILLGAGEQRDLDLEFKTGIPIVIRRRKDLTAENVLPLELNSSLTISHSSGTTTVNLKARVRSAIKLIDPGDTTRPPRLMLRREGDSFFAEFSLYDSDLQDIDHAFIEFFDAQGKVPVDDPVIPLRDAIITKRLVQGQSFTVRQEFTGANSHPKTASFRVTVFGTKSSTIDAATSSANPSVKIASVREGGTERPASERRRPLARSGIATIVSR